MLLNVFAVEGVGNEVTFSLIAFALFTVLLGVYWMRCVIYS